MTKKVKAVKTDTKSLPVLIFIGTQASGKGTQARLICEKYGYTLFEMGHSLRLESKKKNKLGKLIKHLIDNGYLVPSWVARDMLKKYMPSLRRKPLIIDGAPRQSIEARFHEKTLRQFGRRISIVFYIKLSEKEALRRLLKRGRNDDTPESIKRRFAWSRTKLKHIVKYFNGRYPVEIINGEQSIQAVHRDVIKALKTHKII